MQIDLKIALGPDLVKLVAEIDEFKGKWEALQKELPQQLKALRKIATVESIGSSTRIEGASLSDEQVETLLSRLQTSSFQSRDEQEVAGYAEAVDLVFQAFREMPITENHLCQLHQILLKHSTKDERHRGEYKKLPNHVVARDASGKEVGVIFETATPFDTPREMERLVHWTTKAIDEEAMHPLLIIGVFILFFLAIHPFQDGNGRLSRVLTTLMLLRSGYSYVAYESMERIIEENKDLYYKALRRTQISLKKEKQDWEPWLGFFLRCLKKQKDQLQEKLNQEKAAQRSDASLPELSLQIIALLRKRERLTIAEMVDLTGANQNTMKVRLRELVGEGRIQRHGKARATWYSL